ncbi:MAG: hypothetical protein IT532_11390 [Burkholderiales bacterium]|nr:hypothetical protein [Burkholderiales bacterium]
MEAKDDPAGMGSEADLAARFLAAIPARLEADPHLVWRGRHLHTRCMIEIGTTRFLLHVDGGRVPECRSPLPPLSSWDFAIRGSVRAWDGLWTAVPSPGWHDLFALSRRGEMRFEGSLHPFLANLQYFKDLLALPRTRGVA